MLSFRDPQTGFNWHASFRAAQLATPGYHGLPSAIGEINFVEIDANRFGLPEHVLEGMYPRLKVKHMAMIIPERYKVTSETGQSGVAFWIDNNGSDPSTSVTSELGRANVAPLNWAPDKIKADPWMSWKDVVEDGKRYIWCNARGHGFNGLDGRDLGKDWIDGTPTNGATMYHRELGKTAQSIFVPKEYGIGTAAQTLPSDLLTSTYSILVWFPRPEMASYAKRLANISGLLTDEQAAARYANRARSADVVNRGGSVQKGGTSPYYGIDSGEKGMDTESFGFESMEADMEVAHGFEIGQHVIAPPMIPGLWQEEPSVIIVCWPMSEQNAAVLHTPNARPMTGFGWTNK